MLRGLIVLVSSLLFLDGNQFGTLLFWAAVIFFIRFLILIANGIYKIRYGDNSKEYEHEEFVELDKDGNIDWSEYL